jgi:hypothetical protein
MLSDPKPLAERAAGSEFTDFALATTSDKSTAKAKIAHFVEERQCRSC